MKDFAICIKATPIKMSLEMEFQSVTNPSVFYHVRKDVLTVSIKNICFKPSNPPILIVKTNKKGVVRDIRYGYKSMEDYEKEKKNLFYNKNIASYSGQIFIWCIAPIIVAFLFILILNCFYNWWWGWGEWFIPYRPNLDYAFAVIKMLIE